MSAKEIIGGKCPATRGRSFERGVLDSSKSGTYPDFVSSYQRMVGLLLMGALTRNACGPTSAMAMKTLETERTSHPVLMDVGHSSSSGALTCLPPDSLGMLAAAQWQGSENTRGVRALVAECIDDRHPSLNGRVQVRWMDETGAEQILWVPAMSRLSIRKADRVLMIVPDNWPEPMVVGVVDGFARRAEAPPVAAATLVLKPDEAIRVQDAHGREVLEIMTSENGPTVKLLHQDVNIELPGNLSFKADRVELTARAGPVIIKASDDVVCQGEMIRLN
jgi:hypothetical protein